MNLPEQAERLAGRPGFAERVEERFVQGGREYGEAGYLLRPVVELIEEAAEEGRDYAAWSALTLRSLEARGEDSPRLRALLLEMAALGAQAEDLAMRAGELAA